MHIYNNILSTRLSSVPGQADRQVLTGTQLGCPLSVGLVSTGIQLGCPLSIARVPTGTQLGYLLRLSDTNWGPIGQSVEVIRVPTGTQLGCLLRLSGTNWGPIGQSVEVIRVPTGTQLGSPTGCPISPRLDPLDKNHRDHYRSGPDCRPDW